VNFRYPFASAGFSEMWTRWHVSLSSWLRDYLYIPLGGSRLGNIRTYVNLMLTMLLGGLWHGPSWLFVIWGGFQTLYLAAERLLKRTLLAKLNLWQRPGVHIGLVLLTFALWNLAQPFFRARSLNRALDLLAAMLGFQNASDTPSLTLTDFQYQNVVLCTVGTLVIHYLLRNTMLDAIFFRLHWTVRASVVAIMMYLVLICFTGEDSAFLYFQF